ncbi:LysR family transcriptional regulator [Thalassococcus lentus]|uniref:LysR family transcriptional regulator n=1 Tax=Thalassococcus lentus TaxID=1210524 RepID=A0ABT4XUN5_9RHOB|nr:LysR family transcriptional regulator [Thalassococcus lentus]MDA7425680.1 LysR family transcriptional regulator [Thalassococcus lentus]
MRIFLETARSGSVSEAAKRCHLSQPAATQAISRLEADIGVPLLVRRRQRAALTDVGALFAMRAQKALDHLKNGLQAALGEAGIKSRRGTTFEFSVTASQLRNLIAIVNTGSFTMAAQVLGLSQPTVHRAARSLEAVVGTPFFVALPSGVRLTPAAERFVIGAKLAQAELKQGYEEISNALGHEQGTFVLGSLPLARTTIVPKAVHSMVTGVDGFQIRVVEGRYGELLRSLREGDIDCLIGALRYPEPAENVTQELLFRDALTIVTHPKHPLASKRNLRLEDTLDFPWIAPPIETPAGQYLFETLRIGDREQTPVRIVASSLAILRGVLAEGPYVSVVSGHQIKVDQSQGTITPLDIPLSGHLRDIGLTYRTAWKPTAAQETFIGFLRKFSKIATED